jgi:DNA-binding LacI/PurR family transcriptional regulator
MIGFDDFELAALLDVPLSVVRQPVDAAMNSLLRQIKEGDTSGTQTLSMPGQLIIRDLCGCK